MSIVFRTVLIQLIGIAVLVIPRLFRRKRNHVLFVVAGCMLVWIATVVFFPPEWKNMEIVTLACLVFFLILQTILFSVACFFVKLVGNLRAEKNAD